MNDDRGQPTIIVEKGPNSFQSCMGCVGYAFLGLLGLYALGSLTRSDDEDGASSPVEASQELTTDAPAASENVGSTGTAKPVLAGSEYDPSLALRDADPQWIEEPLSKDSNYTPSMGLLRVTHAWQNTNLAVDFTDAGGVHMIHLRSGTPGRCDSGPDLALAFDQFAHDLALGEAAAQLRPKLVHAWSSKDEWAEADIGKVTVRAIGGCPRTLVVKAL